MTKIIKYKLLKMPAHGNIDWSKRDDFKQWEPDPWTRSDISKKIGNVNKKRIGL